MKKSNKRSRISLTAIKTLLKDLAFNPRLPGPMAVISEQGSPEYYELRAIEEIHEARTIRQDMSDAEVIVGYDAHIDKAIQLLLLAKYYGSHPL